MDTNTVQVVTVVLASFSTIATAYIGMRMAEIREQGQAAAKAARRAARRVQQVKEDLRSNQDAVGEKLDDAAKARAEMLRVNKATHTLVNGKRGATLRKLADALRIIASDRPTPENIAAAEQARRDSEEHEDATRAATANQAANPPPPSAAT